MKYPESMNQKVSVRKFKDLYQVAIGNFALFSQTQGAHWNYVGLDFASLHALFEQQYQDLYIAADALAERIRALGDAAPLDIVEMSRELEQIPWFESAKVQSTSRQWIETLIRNHASFRVLLNSAITTYSDSGDSVTHDMLVARLMFHEKALWMLRAVNYEDVDA